MKLTNLIVLAPLALTACGIADPGETCAGVGCDSPLVWMPPSENAKPFPGKVVFDAPRAWYEHTYGTVGLDNVCHLGVHRPGPAGIGGISVKFVRGEIGLEATNCFRILRSRAADVRGNLYDANVHTADIMTPTPMGDLYNPMGRQLMANRPHEWRWPDMCMGLCPGSPAYGWNHTLGAQGDAFYAAVNGPQITPTGWLQPTNIAAR